MNILLVNRNNHGVLILSEFAGAAQSLNGSIIINPWNTDETAQSIYDALNMSKKERAANHQKLFRYVTKYTAAYWGLNFVGELEKVSEEIDAAAGLIKRLDSIMIKELYLQARKKRIIFCGLRRKPYTYSKTSRIC